MNHTIKEHLGLAATPLHPGSVAPGTADTGGIDMQKFRRVAFVMDVGAFGASATVDAKLQESVDNAVFTDVAGTGVSITQMLQAGGNNKLVTLECRDDQLTKRYVRCRVTVGTAATTLCCIPVALEPKTEPQTQDIAAVTQRIVMS